MNPIVWLCLLAHANVCLSFTDTLKKAYDYIIIGGGTAGCVVAGRLSEDAGKSVLVLEAGPDDRKFPNIAVPAAAGSLGNLSWGYLSEPLKYAGHELVGKRTKLHIAKVLGGSCSHNNNDVVRGSRQDFENWETLGNKGWGYEDVLPYFKKSENMVDPKLAENGFHGIYGPWTIKEELNSKLSEVFIQAGKELGYDEVDYNGPSQEGFARMQVNIKQGRRDTTTDAFIRPVMGRRNLHIKTDAFVTKIKFNRNRRAIGVYYSDNGTIQFVRVKKEVIVSAGALNSPKVLMLSGVGPRKHLKKMGIPVVADLPVGKNLQDHIATYLSFFINESLSVTPDKMNTFEALADYVFNGKGFWASAGSAGVCFVKSRSRPVKDKRTHIQLIQLQTLLGYNEDVAGVFRSTFNIVPELFSAIHDVDSGRQGVAIYVMLLHPRTTGVVQLKNKFAYTEPKVRLTFFKNPKDVEEMMEGVRFVQALVQTQPYKAVNATLTFPPHPACRQLKFDSDQYWRCHLKQKSFSFMHYTSSCKMSPGADGVVDNRLRVKKVQNVRVVDASVMPHIVSGNTQAAVIMIAEKAADMIREDAK